MSSETDRHASVESAISRVLAAERDALEQIAASERRAGDLLRETRKTARALVRRTQERISRLHSGAAARTSELVQELEADSDPGPSLDPTAERDARLDAAIRRVARALTVQDAGHAD